MGDKFIVLKQATFDFILKQCKKIAGLKGPGIVNQDDALTIAFPRPIIRNTGGKQPFTPLFFPVQLTEVGGSEGNSTTQASFVYDVSDLDGVLLGEAMTPGKQRNNKGKTISGDGFVGSGYYDQNGDFVLWDANESTWMEIC